jgi:hypothetical protein
MRADCSTIESTGEGIEAGIEESAVVALVLFTLRRTRGAERSLRRDVFLSLTVSLSKSGSH